jgi:hypothetical protein
MNLDNFKAYSKTKKQCSKKKKQEEKTRKQTNKILAFAATFGHDLIWYPSLSFPCSPSLSESE